VDSLSFPYSVLTRKFQSGLGESELDLVIRGTDIVITAIRVTDTGTIHMDTTDHIRTMVITAPRTGIGFTATTVIITTGIGTKLTLGVKPSIKSTELARKRFRASFFKQ
jgi:hypothetical protein